MCGITGLISSNPLTERERATVSKMNQALVNRGPDSQGVINDKHVALAMRRLSIIDVLGGQQPLYNETGTVAVVCNGEIYNYLELREELIRKGHRFSSKSDVEVIAHLYEDMGVEFLGALRGMFSIALWDAEQKRLVLARDRMGEKPLYWYKDPCGHLWFSSEMKSLLKGISEYEPPLSRSAIQLFLTYQYIPEPHTMFEGVRKLSAGHFLSVSVDQLDSQPQSYWHYLSIPEREGDPVQLVREELDTACRIMGRSDVPIGVALSGGIDSAVVAALSARSYPGTLQAFSVGYRGRPGMDERKKAEEVADFLKIPFYDVELAEDDFVRTFPRLVWAMDDPIADIAGYGYYAVSALAREHGVPVLLSGLGGDELFWGYSWIRDLVWENEPRRRFRGAPQWLQKIIGARPEGHRRLMLSRLHKDLEKARAMSRELLSSASGSCPFPEVSEEWVQCDNEESIALPLSQLLNQTWLVSNCLALADRVSMAHSVEMRLPLLDSNLIELVVGLRKNGMRDWVKPHKWLLVEAVKNMLPPDLLGRPKQGFTPPVQEWYGAVCRHYGCLLQSGSLVTRGLIQGKHVENYIAGTPIGYKLLLLEIWCRLFVEGQTPEEVVEQADAFSARSYRAVEA
jgi:asparagine synthase (glutamine-hydrolysing)